MSGRVLSWPITPLMRPHQAGQCRKGERGAGSGERGAGSRPPFPTLGKWGGVYRGAKACNTCSDVAHTIIPAPAPSAICRFVLVSESIAKETRLCQDDPSSQFSS